MNDLQPSFSFEPVERRYSVRELNRLIADLLSVEFSDLWVEGEISDVKISRPGHIYFTLKEQDSVLNCVCFRGSARYLRFRPEEGLAVAARGRVDVYEARGQYQFIVEALEPKGLGALQLAFEQLKKKLAGEGLFDASRKKALPQLPKRIGIVTSPTGAAVRDILHVLQRRCANVHVRIYPALVQGEGAAEQIAAGLRYFSEKPWADVVIVGRGGGSIEDLWSFNTEAVARAIAESTVPVISAVGHETDFTIADFVADLRAPTPSAAAELAVPNQADLLATLDSVRSHLIRAAQLSLLRKRQRLQTLGTERAQASLQRRLATATQRLDDADFRMRDSVRASIERGRRRVEAAEARVVRLDMRVTLAALRSRFQDNQRRAETAMGRILEQKRQREALLRARLESLSPLAILERGYALVSDSSGTLVRDAATLAEGDPLRVRFSRGEAGVRVSTTNPTE